MPVDSVEDLLTAAAPQTRFEVSGHTRAVTIRAARRRAGVRAPRAVRLAVASSLAIVLIGGGAATAFAASPELREWIAPHIQDPYVTIQYTMPSGAICTETWGDAVANNPGAAATLREWLASADVLSLIDVDAALIHLRSEEDYSSAEVGSDIEYSFAVSNALVAAARAELARRGFPPGSIDSWSGEAECTTTAP